MAAAFSGSWVLDTNKSDNTDKLLTAQGVGWIKRQALNSLSQTLTITVAGDQVTFKQETSVSTTEFTLALGGAPVDYQDELTGNKAKRSAKLDGDKLVVVSESADSHLTVVRAIEGDAGNVLHATITHKAKKDGTETVCNRFFNKK